MVELKIMATAVVGAVLTLILKEQKQSMGIAVGITCAMCVLFLGLPYLEKAISYIRVLYSDFDKLGSYMGILLKIAGIATISTFASDLCKDAGVSSVASVVVFCGKIICICLIFPVVESFFQELIKVLP